MQVRAVFGTGNRIVAGCMVNEGMLRKGCVVVVKRGKRVSFLNCTSTYLVDGAVNRSCGFNEGCCAINWLSTANGF
jgi:hypothetical protein